MDGIFHKRYIETNQIAGLGEQGGHVHTKIERFDIAGAVAANTDFTSRVLFFPSECTPLEVRVVSGRTIRYSLRVKGEPAANSFINHSGVNQSDSRSTANAGIITAANGDIEDSSQYPLLKFLKERRDIVLRLTTGLSAAGSGISREIRVILQYLQL